MSKNMFRSRFYLNCNWSFYGEYTSIKGDKIDIPHCPVNIPYNSFDEDIYQDIWHYKKEFKTKNDWSNKTILLTVDGASHKASLLLNGHKIASHNCGYTAFTTDITDFLNYSDNQLNTLEVILDSREILDIPPFGNVIDYMTYAGLYREVFIDVVPEAYIDDVFINPGLDSYESHSHVVSKNNTDGYIIEETFYPADNEEESSGKTIAAEVINSNAVINANNLTVKNWSLETPYLYTLKTRLKDKAHNIIDEKITTFGFRTIRFDKTGFYLNGNRIKLRGLNRHQSYPYTGYAMPEELQRDDAIIIKEKLGCNIVRTSHYPQSRHFIDQCDRSGLLVFTEIPGWQHIGSSDQWKEQTVENVRDMVTLYRNHPSIILWGVRINESQDDDTLYKKTNHTARTLDPSRPTGGVRFLQNSHFFEDVYTYNDFVHNGTNTGLLHKKKVTSSNGGYLVSEYCGHMFPTKSFDNEEHRTQQAIRHARIIEDAAAFDELSGAVGWCAFDYHTHNDFGSGDRICYHGVMDMYRNPKLAASVYASQRPLDANNPELEISSDVHIGDYPAGTLGEIWAFTNAPAIKVYDNGAYIKTYTHRDSPFTHIKNGPILIDDMIGDRLVTQDGIPSVFAPLVKKLLFIIRKYTVEGTPLKYKILFALLMMTGILSVKKMEKLYFKYMGSWGGNSREYKFEAVDEKDNVIKTVIRGTRSKDIHLSVTPSRTSLINSTTYDAVEINVLAVDESNNLQHYCQEPFTVKTEGPCKLLSPEIDSLKGGMSGIYVRSLEGQGTAKITIKDWQGKQYVITIPVKTDTDAVQL